MAAKGGGERQQEAVGSESEEAMNEIVREALEQADRGASVEVVAEVLRRGLMRLDLFTEPE